MGGETTPFVRRNFTSFKMTNLMVEQGMHQFISHAWYCLLFYYSRFDVKCGIQNYFRVWRTMSNIASWHAIVHGVQDKTLQPTGANMQLP